MLELAVLGLPADQPRHGYDLKKRLSETLGPLWGISFGSLYPALRRLERGGEIEEVDEEAGTGAGAGFVPTGSLPRRPAAAPGPPDAPHPQGLPDHRPRPCAVRRVAHRRLGRRRAGLRAEAVVLS